jgi:hypothetical protein
MSTLEFIDDGTRSSRLSQNGTMKITNRNAALRGPPLGDAGAGQWLNLSSYHREQEAGLNSPLAATLEGATACAGAISLS